MNVDLKKFVGRGERIAVAVSGGADSTVLLDYLLSQKEEYGFSVYAINVEHGIRGETSRSDSEFVAEVCRARGVKLFAYAVDSPALAAKLHISMEQAARQLRYQCFENLLAAGECDKIATAHHMKDNAETVLMNLFRGSSLKGAAGIRPVNGRIIRPFIGVSKAEILAYAAEKGIAYVEDESNVDEGIKRNFVRLQLLPAIEKIFPEAERAICRFAETARAEDDYLEKSANALITEHADGVAVRLPADEVLLARAAITAMKKLGLKADYGQKHANAAVALSARENGSALDLPCGVSARKEYDKLFFYCRTAAEDPRQGAADKIRAQLRWQDTLSSAAAAKETKKIICAPAERSVTDIGTAAPAVDVIPFAVGKYICRRGVLTIERVGMPQDLRGGFYGDLGKIPHDAVIRTRQAGDRFTAFGGAHKRLKEFFIDKKVPGRIRDEIPLVASGNEIIFAGIAISDKIKVDKTTESVVQFRYTEE